MLTLTSLCGRTAVAAVFVMASAGGTAAAAEVPPQPPLTIEVDASKPFKAVDHAASGSLYGIADEGWPSDRWIAPTKPKMFTQPPPGATHRPNGEPAPVGDTLKVWRAAGRNGATVTIRLPDIFPTFPYEWRGDDYWYAQVERIVNEVKASGMDNVYGYEIWNEPQWTWNPDWGDYFAMWDRTYRLIRRLDPTAPIVGPSYDRDYMAGIEQFMKHAVAADTVPDVVSWHELGPEEGLEVTEHVARYREIEHELKITPRPISINEYGSPRDAGVPGWLTRFVAKLERARVDTADLAFWHKPGRLSDLLVPEGGGAGPAFDADPTGNYALFKWYGQMTGHMVETTPPKATGRTIERGTPTPAGATRTAGRPGAGNAIALNGGEPNQYVELPDGIVDGLTDFTISAWVDVDGTTQWRRVFDFGTGTTKYMFLTPRSGDGTARFAITTSGGGGEQTIDADAPLPSGWTHVEVVKSGSTGTLYVNGEAVGTNPDMTLSPKDLGPTTQNWIGRSQYADPNLTGKVDDFEIDGVASYAFDEDGGATVSDSSGHGNDARVVTRVEGVEQVPAPDAFASADRRGVRVVLGGGRGDLQLKVKGLRGFGGRARVQVSKTEWTGTDGVSGGPRRVFGGTYRVRDGRISVPLEGLDDHDAYLATITRTGRPDRVDRHEAERRHARQSRLASDNAYAPRGAFAFSVRARHAGAYDLRIRYSNPGAGSVAGTVNGDPVSYAPTPAVAPFATHAAHVVLHEGRNRIRLTGAVAVDYVDVTPFRERVEFEDGEPTGASPVTVDMSEANFFASAFSNDAYLAGLGAVKLPVTAPAAGRYRLRISYSTAGTEEERRAQTRAFQLLRVDGGPWQRVAYDPTQFREMLRQVYVTVRLPAGTSTLELTKGGLPGTVDLDSVDVMAPHG